MQWSAGVGKARGHWVKICPRMLDGSEEGLDQQLMGSVQDELLRGND